MVDRSVNDWWTVRILPAFHCIGYVSIDCINLYRDLCVFAYNVSFNKQESPAIADKPARRESLPKIAPIRRAYNVVADDTGLFIRLAVVASEICEIPRNSLKIQTYGVQGHLRSSILVTWCQWKAHM